MTLLPKPTNKAFDRIIFDEFNRLIERRTIIAEDLLKIFEENKEALAHKTRGTIRAKIELDMKPKIRQEAAIVFEYWLSQLLLDRFSGKQTSE